MINVSNQVPVDMNPVYKPVVNGVYTPQEYIKQTMVSPLLSLPIIANNPVVIKEGNNDLTEDDITQFILDCSGDTINVPVEELLKELFGKTLLSFDQNTPLSIQETFAIQSAKKENMPSPTPSVVYTPATDVIPSAKGFLAGTVSYDNFFASLAFYARPSTLGFYFVNENAFNDFKTWLLNETNQLASILPFDTNQLYADFQTLTLDGLTESLILRNDDGDNNHDYSFARTIIYFLMQYTSVALSNAIFGVLPFRVDELFNPKTIVFVNVEKHARATSKQIAAEWNIINSSLQSSPKIVNTNKLKKLTSVARTMKKVMANAQMQANNKGAGIQRAARLKFQKTPPTNFDLTRRVKKVMNNMAQVNRSDNSFKSIKSTYQKANRRDPDDFNKPGITVSTKYKPDIHLYLDTSGSISEQNYQDAVKACIRMAKKLNVNLYFNSFSHVLSQETKLELKNKTSSQIYKQFQKVPKVTGGTEYEQIWHYINRSKRRKRELSIIMTDFEWRAPNHHVNQPKNLYYAPISNVDWNYLVIEAERFCKSMTHLNPKIRAKLLF